MFQDLNTFDNVGNGGSKSLIILNAVEVTMITIGFTKKPFNFKCDIFLCFLPWTLSSK